MAVTVYIFLPKNREEREKQSSPQKPIVNGQFQLCLAFSTVNQSNVYVKSNDQVDLGGEIVEFWDTCWLRSQNSFLGWHISCFFLVGGVEIGTESGIGVGFCGLVSFIAAGILIRGIGLICDFYGLKEAQILSSSNVSWNCLVFIGKYM